MKVTNLWLSLSSGICQNPEAVFNVEKTVEPPSLAIKSSGVGRMNLSVLTTLFSFYKSTQMPALPDLYGPGTNRHNSVGSVTISMISLASIRSNSSTLSLHSGGEGGPPDSACSVNSISLCAVSFWDTTIRGEGSSQWAFTSSDCLTSCIVISRVRFSISWSLCDRSLSRMPTKNLSLMCSLTVHTVRG